MKDPKCFKCPSRKFDFGKITIGKDGFAEVVFCAKCGAIVPHLEHTLKKPTQINESKQSTVIVPIKVL